MSDLIKMFLIFAAGMAVGAAILAVAIGLAPLSLVVGVGMVAFFGSYLVRSARKT